MKIYDVPISELRRIATDLGVRFEGDDVSNSRGLRAKGRLMPLRGENPYQRVSASPFMTKKDGSPRRIGAVCWHGHRDWMRAVFNAYPDARIVTGLAGDVDYRGADDFERTHRDTGARNIGSMMYPVAFADACACPESGDTSGVDAKVQAAGPLSREEARELASYWRRGRQSSALYALASSGYTRPDAAISEVNAILETLTPEGDGRAAIAKLHRLAAWIADNAATIDPMAGRVNVDPVRGA